MDLFAAPAQHGHLWLLRDGTPAHAPPGRLTTDDDGRIACHLCGSFYRHLGVHLRRHGWTAGQYRDAVGLTRHTPLCARALSGRIARRQTQAWQVDPAIRARFEVGQNLARSGELGRLGAAATRERDRTRATPESVADQRQRVLAAGRALHLSRLDRHRKAVLTVAGVGDLSTYIVAGYLAGLSLGDLARVLKIGHQRIHTELATAGIAVRPSGVNRTASKHARAARFNARVEAALGIDDIARWLRDQRADGASWAVLSARTGRSIPWVQSRVAGTTTTNRPASTGSG